MLFCCSAQLFQLRVTQLKEPDMNLKYRTPQGPKHLYAILKYLENPWTIFFPFCNFYQIFPHYLKNQYIFMIINYHGCKAKNVFNPHVSMHTTVPTVQSRVLTQVTNLEINFQSKGHKYIRIENPLYKQSEKSFMCF